MILTEHSQFNPLYASVTFR